MRIAIYYEQREYGGVDTFLSYLVNYWPSTKHEFVIITNCDNGGLDFLAESIKNPNVTIKLIPPDSWYAEKQKIKLIRMLYLARSYVLFLFRFSKCIKLVNPDVILISNGSYPGGISSFLAAIISKLRSYPCLFLVHHAILHRSIRPTVIAANFLAYIIMALKIKTLTVSLASKKMLEKFTPLKELVVIYNGLSLETPPTGVNIKSEFNLPNKILIGTIGRLDNFKGHKTIIKAFLLSSFLRKNAQYVIVGSGNNLVMDKLIRLVSNYNLEKSVTFTGFIRGNPIEIVKSFDILAMPTKDFEGFGYAYAEAMFAGVPVVASNVGAIPEVIEDKVSGYIVNPEDIREWARILQLIIQDKKKREFISLNGIARIQKKFSADCMSNKYHALFSEEIASNNG